MNTAQTRPSRLPTKPQRVALGTTRVSRARGTCVTRRPHARGPGDAGRLTRPGGPETVSKPGLRARSALYGEETRRRVPEGR